VSLSLGAAMTAFGPDVACMCIVTTRFCVVKVKTCKMYTSISTYRYFEFVLNYLM